MDHPEAATTRRQLGELGVMSAQVERSERQIMQRAQALHSEVLGKIDAARAAAAAGKDEQAYQDLVAERGRLERVIAQAQQVLNPT